MHAVIDERVLREVAVSSRPLAAAATITTAKDERDKDARIAFGANDCSGSGTDSRQSERRTLASADLTDAMNKAQAPGLAEERTFMTMWLTICSGAN